jgi:hypothetical protein
MNFFFWIILVDLVTAVILKDDTQTCNAGDYPWLTEQKYGHEEFLHVSQGYGSEKGVTKMLLICGQTLKPIYTHGYV